MMYGKKCGVNEKYVFDKNSKKTGENETKTGKLEGIVKTWSLQAKTGDVTGLYIYIIYIIMAII